VARRTAPHAPDTRPPLIELRGARPGARAQAATGEAGFALAAGEFVAATGAAGTGTTRLLDLLSGFVRPAAGTVLMEGRPVTALTPAARARRGLGRGFRVPALVAGLDVGEHLALARTARGARRHGGDTPETALAAVGLTGMAARPVGALGPGGRRRLEIAVLRAMGARAFILDEPTAGIPAAEIAELLAIVAALRTLPGAGVLVAEREAEPLRAHVDRMIVLTAGGPVAAAVAAQKGERA